MSLIKNFENIVCSIKEFKDFSMFLVEELVLGGTQATKKEEL